MVSIELMKEEHVNIRRMIAVLQKRCIAMMNGAPVDPAELRQVISFIREYSDAHHHGKEEQFLFPVMTEKLGRVADNLINHGMLVEHDLGRGHVLALEEAVTAYEKDPSDANRLDILTEAMSWGKLLERHTKKEDDVVYPFAERALSQEDKDRVDAACTSFEEDPKNVGIRDKWLSFLEEMEQKA